MQRGWVHSVESCGAVDGPGIRFVVFFQGCMFRCQYCHNRDTWPLHRGKSISSKSLLQEALTYSPYLHASQGGVTATGGEPLLQASFLAEWFSSCQQAGLHTCLDTNGSFSPLDPAIKQVLAVTDLVMLDIKQIDNEKHKQLTGTSNTQVLTFANHLEQRNRPFWIRHVIIPGHTDDLEDIKKLSAFLASFTQLEKIELHPYHTMGSYKWALMGEQDPLEGTSTPTSHQMEAIRTIFLQDGHLQVVY